MSSYQDEMFSENNRRGTTTKLQITAIVTCLSAVVYTVLYIAQIREDVNVLKAVQVLEKAYSDKAQLETRDAIREVDRKLETINDKVSRALQALPQDRSQ